MMQNPGQIKKLLPQQGLLIMAHILIHAPRSGDLPSLSLAMKSARINFTRSHNREELLNWINAFHLQLVVFDLLLFYQLPEAEDAAVIDRALQIWQLPILYIKRSNRSPDHLRKHTYIPCPPKEMATCINKYLNGQATAERRFAHDN